MYSQKTLNKHQFLVLRLVYYGYWYWLLYTDVSKYIIVMLTFGYLIITSMQPPTLTPNEQEDKVNSCDLANNIFNIPNVHQNPVTSSLRISALNFVGDSLRKITVSIHFLSFIIFFLIFVFNLKSPWKQDF